MDIVGRVQFPKSADLLGLYIQCNEGALLNYQSDCKQIVFRQGGLISSNSYFNSFYEKFYTQYTQINSLYYLLKLEGNFQVSVFRECYGKDNREVIWTEKLENCQLTDSVKISIPTLNENETAGRIYLEILCLSERGLFEEGLIATEQNKTQEVSLAIISCTFKKEAYIKDTVNTIVKDKFLYDKNFKIFVVDNGLTLTEDDFPDPRVKLTLNRNVGGSGGFTRGLIEALQSSNSYSHFLLMDDDIELDSESIYRLFSIYEYAKFDFAVAGSMLDLYKKHLLYEAGALYGKHPETKADGPFSVTPLKHNVALQDVNNLNLLLLEETPDYGAFWFFAFSKKMLEEMGLPLPFFIRMDDIEFGLRITEDLGKKIVAFPSIAVWHEPFYTKYPIWDNYYVHRNSLISDTIHGSLTYINAVKQIAEGLIISLSVFDYNSARMVLEGFEDYLKGPSFIKKTDPELLHSNRVKLSKSYKNQTVQSVDSPPNRYEQSKTGILKKIVSLLTINGHLLPSFLISNDEVLIWHGPGYTGQRTKAFAKKRVLLFREGNNYLFQNEMDKVAGVQLLIQGLKLAAKSRIRWSSIAAEWKNSSKELTSMMFWQEYLGLKK